jgi:nitrogen fixation NifU-like protein/NifU-like protein
MTENKHGESGGHPWAYSKEVQEHFFNPKNVMLDEGDYEYDGKGSVGNPVCGDEMIVWIRVDSETNRIKDCRWRTFGCAAAISATSMMSVMVTEEGGMELDKAKDLKPENIMERLMGLPNRKTHCSVLGQNALVAAIEDYLSKTNNDKNS